MTFIGKLLVFLGALLFSSAFATTPRLDQATIDVLNFCDRSFKKEDINKRELIQKITVNGGGSCNKSPTKEIDGLATYAAKILYQYETDNGTAELLDLVNSDALEKSLEAYFSYSVTRTLNPLTHKPYDLNNAQDVGKLVQIACEQGICNSEKHKQIMKRVFQKVRNKNLKFTYKTSELSAFQAEIKNFNDVCTNLKKVTAREKDMVLDYKNYLALETPALSQVKTGLTKMFDAPLGWLLLTESMRKTIRFDGNDKRVGSFCDTPLKTPSAVSIETAKIEFQKLQLEEIKKTITLAKEDYANQDALSIRNHNRSHLKERILNNPSSIADVLAKNPKPEYAASVCTLVHSIYK